MKAADALAEIWRAGRSKKDERERALEVALASALTCPGAWEKVARVVQPDPRSTSAAPVLVRVDPSAIRRQTQRGADRTDIELCFGERWVVLELKFGAPPDKQQVERYAAAEDVDAVVTVAASRPAYDAHKLAGAVTWRELLEISWPAAPLPWQQLCALVRAMGLLMPTVDHSALKGLQASWDVPEQLEAWAEHAAKTVRTRMTRNELAFVLSESGRDTRHTSWRHRRLATRVWPVGWGGAPWACVYVGFFFGRPGDPTLDSEYPDLLLTWHTDFESPLGRALGADAAVRSGVARWRARTGDTVSREAWFHDGAWELIRARSSSRLLAESENPQTAFQAWVGDRLAEWEADGIMDALSSTLLRVGALGRSRDASVSLSAEDEAS